MILPNSFFEKRKGKSSKMVKAGADFSATDNSKGKIVAENFSGLKCGSALAHAGSFVPFEREVLQIVPCWEALLLKPNGLVGQSLVFSQFAGCQGLTHAYDQNTQTLVVSGKDVGTYAISNNVATQISSLYFESIAFCQSRLFASIGDAVYFTAPTERAFEENLYVRLPTKVVSLVNNGELYAIGCDVYKLDIDAEESKIKVRVISRNVGNVVANSVSAYANKIYFVANNKACYLAHAVVKVIKQLDFTPSFATLFGGAYFIGGNNGVLGLSVTNGKVVCSFAIDCQGLVAQEALYAVEKGCACRLEDKLCPSFWKSQWINFDQSDSVKYLHRLTISTTHNVDVHVVSDARRIYHVKGKEGIQSFMLTGYGNGIKVELYSSGKMQVDYLQICARTYEVDR